MTRRQRFPFSWIQTVGIIIRKLHSHIVLFNGTMHSDWIFESLVLYTKSNNGKQVFQKTRETKRTRKWNWASITCTDCRGKNNNHFSSYQSLSQYACLNHFSSYTQSFSVRLFKSLQFLYTVFLSTLVWRFYHTYMSLCVDCVPSPLCPSEASQPRPSGGDLWVSMAGLQEESVSAGAIHVAQGKCAAAGAAGSVCRAAGPWAGHQCVCTHLQQKYRWDQTHLYI